MQPIQVEQADTKKLHLPCFMIFNQLCGSLILQFLHLEARFLKVFNISITNFGTELGIRKLTPIVPSLFFQNV